MTNALGSTWWAPFRGSRWMVRRTIAIKQALDSSPGLSEFMGEVRKPGAAGRGELNLGLGRESRMAECLSRGSQYDLV